jgi:hypothetical protein
MEQDVRDQGSTRVTWEIEQVGDSCRLTVVHDQLPESANAELYGGWPMILSGLKTLLETGELLTTPSSLMYAGELSRWSETPRSSTEPRLARVFLMTASDDYCELCDLPRSQCIHGQPPPPAPTKAVKAAPAPRKRAATTRGPAPDKPVTRRWTTPEAFRPLILEVLEEAEGSLEADELFGRLELLVGDRLLPGDSESTPEGELRWRYAARRARIALIAEGLMTKTTPGIWQLAPPGRGVPPARA